MKRTKKIIFDFSKHLIFIPITVGNTDTFYKWDENFSFEETGVILLERPFGIVVEKSKRKIWVAYIKKFVEHYNCGFEL
jgi:hypothetical protein